MQRVTPSQKGFMNRTLARYGIAAALAAVGFLLRLPFSHILGSAAPYITFYPAIMLAAIIGGLGPGLLATAVSSLFVIVMILPPIGGIRIDNDADIIALVLFLLMGAFMSTVAELYRRARDKAAIYERDAAVCETEAKYRELVENANSAIIRWKSDGTIVFFNEYAQKFFGYSAQEILGKPVSILVPEVESTGANLTKLIEDIVNHPDKNTKIINENILRDGRRVWMAWTNKAVFDENGKVVEILAVGTDITERRLAEQREKELEAHKLEFYRRTILAATGDRLVVTEPTSIDSMPGERLGEWAFHSISELFPIREEAGRLVDNLGLPPVTRHRLLCCIGEMTSNAIKHAKGGKASLYRNSNDIRFVVKDHGPGIAALNLPNVALVTGYSTVGTGGYGYKMMIKCADKVYLATGSEGTTVAVEIEIER